jgi:hypothetical protein
MYFCRFADLGVMEKYKYSNRQVEFLLVVVDALSQFVFIRGLTNRKAATVARAFQELIQETKRCPANLTTDAGVEFTGKLFQEVFFHYFKIQYILLYVFFQVLVNNQIHHNIAKGRLKASLAGGF